eukprot:4078567-Prorocentrum_lima.AAC.1
MESLATLNNSANRQSKRWCRQLLESAQNRSLQSKSRKAAQLMDWQMGDTFEFYSALSGKEMSG